jgi:ligand-binding sensor domain-containing protein
MAYPITALILLTGKGVACIGTESDRLYQIDSAFNITGGSLTMTGSTRNKINSFTQTRDGAIWAATDGNGIFRFLNDSVTAINRANDLMSNYCYSILADDENNVWMARLFQDLIIPQETLRFMVLIMLKPESAIRAEYLKQTIKKY